MNKIDPSAQSPVVYSISRAWKITICIFSPPMIGLGIWFASTAFTGDRTGDIAYTLIALIFGMGLATLFLYSLAAILKSRLEIHADRIRDIGVFKTKELLFDNIEGYRIVPTQYVRTIEFVSVKSKNFKTSLIFRDNEKLIKWADETFRNLDRQEYEKEMELVRTDRDLGFTEKERTGNLNRVKKWEKVLSFIYYPVCFWGLIYPQPYDVVVWVLVLLPLSSLALIYASRGIIRLDTGRYSPYPNIFFGFSMPGLILALRAFIDYNILEWHSFWIPFAIITLILYLSMLAVSKDVRKKVVSATVMIPFCGIYGYGAAITLNGVMDTSTPVPYHARVVDKHISNGKRTSYEITVSPWGPRKDTEDVSVPIHVYEKYEAGEIAEILVRRGALDIPWYYMQ